MNAIPFELDVQMFLRLLIAVVLGALVGYERERAGSRPVYGRTAWSASALFAAISIHGFGGTGDAALVAAQIVMGIGFVGAGAILHQRSSAHGLTTAVSLWVTAAVGVGMVFMSLATAVLVFLLLRFCRCVIGLQ